MLLKTYYQWWKTWKTLPINNWIKAAQQYRNNNYTDAAKLYQAGLKKHFNHPASHCARMDLAYCLFRVQDFKEAEKELRHVINSDPQLKEAYLRLSRLQIWSGRPLEACWTIRRALKEEGIGNDAEVVATFLFAIIENGGPTYLLQEALNALSKLSDKEKANTKIEIALAKLAIFNGDKDKGRTELSRLASLTEAPFEAVVAFAEVLLDEGRIAHARQQLRRAMLVAPNHPKVLFLFAKSYLQEGPFFNAEYATQLATSACQNAGWSGPRELHLLAQCYSYNGDKLSALVVAHKAKDAGSRLLGNYGEAKNLEKLIESLSSAQ